MEGPITAGALATPVQTPTTPPPMPEPEKWAVMPAELSNLVEMETQRMLERRSQFVAEVEGSQQRRLPQQRAITAPGGSIVSNNNKNNINNNNNGANGHMAPVKQGCGGRYYILKHGQRYYLLQLPCCRVARYVFTLFFSTRTHL